MWINHRTAAEYGFKPFSCVVNRSVGQESGSFCICINLLVPAAAPLLAFQTVRSKRSRWIIQDGRLYLPLIYIRALFQKLKAIYLI